jgi:hypothetical protein
MGTGRRCVVSRTKQAEWSTRLSFLSLPNTCDRLSRGCFVLQTNKNLSCFYSLISIQTGYDISILPSTFCKYQRRWACGSWINAPNGRNRYSEWWIQMILRCSPYILYGLLISCATSRWPDFSEATTNHTNSKDLNPSSHSKATPRPSQEVRRWIYLLNQPASPKGDFPRSSQGVIIPVKRLEKSTFSKLHGLEMKVLDDSGPCLWRMRLISYICNLVVQCFRGFTELSGVYDTSCVILKICYYILNSFLN